MNGPITRATSVSRLPPLIIACIAATWLIWGSTYLAIRFALRGFPPFVLMSTRFLCAGGPLFAWQLLRGVSAPTLREWRNAFVIGALMLGGGMGGVAYAEQTIGSGLVVAFIAVVPLLLVLVSLAYRVLPRRAEIVAVTVGLVGVVMLTRGQSFHGSPRGLLAMSIACLAWTLGSILSQRSLKLAPGAMGFASEMLCGGGILLFLSAVSDESWRLPAQVGSYLAWIYLVVLGTLVAFSAYMILLERVSTSLASSYTLVNPVVALALGESLVPRRSAPGPGLLGSLVMIACVAAAVLAIFDGQYLSWTPIGSATIDGVQGRYFVPLLPFLGLALPAFDLRGGDAIRQVLRLPTALAGLAGLVVIPALVVATYYLR